MGFDSIPTSEKPEQLLSDSTTFPGWTVYGSAVPGASQSLPLWQIWRVSTTGHLTVQYANKTGDNSNVWSTRASIVNWG